jgi:regulator of telomere elongation helicase 1
MPTLTIAGIPVEFPKNPYPCQVAYMEKVIEALNKKQNALLESPTGTGKTLCLLCATLAWQKANNANQPTRNPAEVEIKRQPSQSSKSNGGPGQAEKNPNFSAIIYATRTHSQLAQVVDELRKTNYRPRMSILGSREQLCIHEKVSKLPKGSVINHGCATLNARRGCMYRNNLEGFMGPTDSEVLDIEDLNKMGRQKKVCPYFYSRETSKSSDIVFMPYNYLLDNAIRKSLDIPWENAIIIFDEAHNLEQVASEAASFSYTSADMASCIQELQEVLKMLKEDFETAKYRKEEANEEKNEKKPSFEVSTGGSSSSVEKPSLERVMELLRSMLALEQYLDHVTLCKQPFGESNGEVLDGSWLVNGYTQSGFLDERVSFYIFFPSQNYK